MSVVSAALRIGWGEPMFASEIGRGAIGRRSGSVSPQVVLDTISVSDHKVKDFGSTRIKGLSGIGLQHQDPCRSSLNS